MATCEVCGNNTSERTISQIQMCHSCFVDLQKIRNGDLQKCDIYKSFPYASGKARQYFLDTIQEKLNAEKTEEQILAEAQNIRDLAIKAENEKQQFANSFKEYYEYDVVTLINVDHGKIDKEKMINLLNERAQKGWKLHTVYSNELGKNALKILGFGINSTACEDVLIFERRIEQIK